jgi:hypothetical protein
MGYEKEDHIDTMLKLVSLMELVGLRRDILNRDEWISSLINSRNELLILNSTFCGKLEVNEFENAI